MRRKHPIEFALLALAWLLLVPAASADDNAPPAGRVHVVTIKQMAFHPAALEVRVGDTVEWVNEGFVPHNMTAEATPNGERAFASALMPMKAVFRHRVTAAGTFPYTCTLHPMMTGTLTVK